MDWGGWIEAAVAVLLVAGVYVLMWWRVGVDRSGWERDGRVRAGMV